MTSTTNGAPHSPHQSKPSRPRRKIRQATLILPTGRRVKRNVTFGPSVGLDGANGANENEDAGETSPLLKASSGSGPKSGLAQRLKSRVRQIPKQTWEYLNSKTGHGVFKCSIAYFLGSLATFVPQIAAVLSQQDGKHMVATVTVYFHPARSIGNMFDGMFCAVIAFLYAAVISFSSMGVSIFFGDGLHQLVLGHVLVLIFFCGGGLGLVGWVKQKLSNPLVNVSCSLTSLALITVLTKEGAVQAADFSADKVTQVMIMIAMGVFATTAVCFIIWPISARTELRKEFVQVTDSFGELLTIITQGFLSGSDEELHQPAFKNAMGKYKKLYTSLTKNLGEAKREHYILGTEREFQLEAKLVHCMQRLGQNIGGLRSAANTQFLVLEESGSGDSSGSDAFASVQESRESIFPHMSTDLMSPSERFGVIDSVETEEADTQNKNPHAMLPAPGSDTTPSTPDDIFSSFIIQLGPSMKSLAITLRRMLDELPFATDGGFTVNAHFSTSLTDAIRLYTKSRQEALELLYKSKEIKQVRAPKLAADFEEVAASCGYFSFSLLAFANEMKVYLGILDDLKLEVEERPEGRTWSWLKVWLRLPWLRGRYPHSEENGLIDRNVMSEVPQEVQNPLTRNFTNASQRRKKTTSGKIRYRIWCALSFFRRDDIKFAIKVGAGAAIYALPSFLASTRPIYQHWRGEWGLLSYMLVCSMTVGASNTTGFARFFGTCLGAVCAIITWIASQGNAYLLAFFGWIMSYWTSYIIVAIGNGPLGRFIMLTYNLSALYAYSLSVKDTDRGDDEGGVTPIITEIALHRVVAVLAGCLWGLIVTRLIWPITARQKFKDGLSLLWFRMGLIWKRDPLHQLLPSSPETSKEMHPYMDLHEEFDLRAFLERLDKLRNAATSEVDFSGPFRNDIYDRVLDSTGIMLDAFHALNIMIREDPRASEGEAEILKYTAPEREMLGARISHLFQVLASSMKLQFPLNEALPSTENARDRLLTKVFRFRRERKGEPNVTDEDFELLYAYVLVTGQLSKEIHRLVKEMEELFGTMDEELLRLE